MSNVDNHREAHETFNNKGADAAGAFFAPDVIYTDEATGETLKGQPQVTGWEHEWKKSFSDALITDATYLDAGEWTISRFRARGTNDGELGPFPATGRVVDVAYCELLRWEDGKIAEGSMYYDTMSVLVQLGHVDPMPS